ncbi:MAG: hypothetical protein ACRDAI_00625 [Candidatus Rhabdochlamydia sp.]
MNYINCIKHSIFIPETKHRCYDLDLQGNENSKIRRIALTAIPFIALYRPAGTVISLGMGSCRVISHLQLIAAYQEKQEWKNLSKEVVLTTLAVVSLASNILHIRIGQLLTSSVDTTQSACYTTYYALTGNYHKAAEEALQTIISTFYLTFIFTGSLEVILLSVLFQAALHLYQIKDDLFKERYIEATAKLAMIAIRLNQANNYRCLIQKRNAFLALQKYQNLIHQASKGRASWQLIRHPLADLHKKIDANKVTLSNIEKEYDFGSHFHGYGKSLVKGANLAFRTVMVDGKELTECEFKINHVFREKLQNTLVELQKLSPSEISDILHITNSHVQSLSIEEHQDTDSFDPYQEVYRIVAEGLGQITIGSSREFPNLFDRVVVLMDKEKNLFDLHELLSLVNLDTAIMSSSKDDLDRLKMGHLFRIFFPREATRFERTEAFFTLSTQELLDKMTPQMKEIYDRYFDQIKESEILPGRLRYKVSGLVDEIQELGGRYLVAAIGDNNPKLISSQQAFAKELLEGIDNSSFLAAIKAEMDLASNQSNVYQRAASMLSLGMISQEMKIKHQINQYGYGWDFPSGGADSIYTQMLMAKDLTPEGIDTRHLDYQSKVRLLISLDALETGTYQYVEGRCGNRIVDDNELFEGSYDNRLNILEFTNTLQQSSDKEEYSSNEVMLKDRISPSYFKGFLVDNRETYKELLDHLRTCNLVQKDALNRETIQGQFVEDFIRISADSSHRQIA